MSKLEDIPQRITVGDLEYRQDDTYYTPNEVGTMGGERNIVSYTLEVRYAAYDFRPEHSSTITGELHFKVEGTPTEDIADKMIKIINEHSSYTSKPS